MLNDRTDEQYGGFGHQAPHMVIIKNPFDALYDYVFFQEKNLIKFGVIQRKSEGQYNDCIIDYSVINAFDIVCYLSNRRLLDNNFNLFYDDDDYLILLVNIDSSCWRRNPTSNLILIENPKELERLFKSYLKSQGVRVYG